MTHTIYKYPLTQPEGDDVVVEMPEGARVLSVQVQRHIPCIWALVDPEKQLEKRRFRIYGTGQRTSLPDAPYIGTVQLLDGRLVYHLFEVTR